MRQLRFGQTLAESQCNLDYAALDLLDRARIDAVIEDARRESRAACTTYGRRNYCAHPHAAGGYVWSIEDEITIYSGIKHA